MLMLWWLHTIEMLCFYLLMGRTSTHRPHSKVILVALRLSSLRSLGNLITLHNSVSTFKLLNMSPLNLVTTVLRLLIKFP